jgi:hypothetical protein
MYDSSTSFDHNSAALQSCQEIARSDHVRTVAVSNFPDLVPHLASWDHLAWDAPQGIPTLMPGWVDAFLRHKLSSDERWLCSFAYIGDRLVGVLPIVITPHPFLGASWPILRTPFDAHTPSGDVLLASDCAAAAFKALLAEVSHHVPNHLGFDFKAVRQSSSLWTAVEGGIKGYITRPTIRWKYSFLKVEGDINGYRSSLGQIRSDVKRGRKKLEARGAVSIELGKGSVNAEELLKEFIALEASGWKGRSQSAMVNNPNVIAFYTTLVRNLASQGRVEWKAIRVDDKLVAAELCIRCGGSLTQPKQAYDEDFADCKPGHLLRDETIKDAFSRAELVEFNPMSDAHAHRRWHMPLDNYTDVHLIRQGLIPVCFQLPRIAARAAYQSYVRPRIPVAMKKAYQSFRRRGDRKPLRSPGRRSARDA